MRESKQFELSSDLAGVSGARKTVRAAVTSWTEVDADADALDILSLVASELITNALRHSGSAIVTVDISVESAPEGFKALLRVDDSSTAAPHLRATGAQETSGRGLLLVERYTGGAWGFELTADGKSVWAEVRLPAPAPPPSPCTRFASGLLRAAPWSVPAQHLQAATRTVRGRPGRTSPSLASALPVR